MDIFIEHLKHTRIPTIIAGDFNDVPLSDTYRRINNRYKDAFIEGGRGIGATYNGKLPMLRIDYVFHSDEFGCRKFKVLNQSTTDHFPIMAELYIRRE